MLRNIFVFLIITGGVVFAVQSPFYALLFYLWNAYFRPELWVWSGWVLSLNLSWFIGLYLVAATALSMPRLRLNMRTALIFLFFADTLLAALASESPNWSWAFWIEFAKVMLISYFIVILVTDRKRFRLALLVITLSLGLECAKQGWAQTILNPGAKNDNNIPFLGDNNGVALGTMMLVPIIGALAETATRRWERNFHRFIMVGVFLRGITTYSRGGFLAAGALGLLKLLRSPRKIEAIAVIAISATIVGSVMPQQFWDRMNTITTAPAEAGDDSAASRIHFWQVAITMANAKPLTGVGFNGYSQVYEKYNTTGEFGGVRAVHSMWFGALADMGYPGFALFVITWALALWSCVRISARTRLSPDYRDLHSYARAFETSLIVYAVGGSFLPGQYNEMYWHFVGLSTALFLVADAELSATQTVTRPQVSFAPALGELSHG
jgi:probable O-glycosylation ligase (exosortase A-associated)